MQPEFQNLVVDDGQLAATATAVTAGKTNYARRYNLTFANTGSNTETLTLTYSRNGGTQRRFRKVLLDPDEVFEITGLPINKADVLYGSASDAGVVDYLISLAPNEAPLTSQVYGADGMPKTTPWIAEQLAAVLG